MRNNLMSSILKKVRKIAGSLLDQKPLGFSEENKNKIPEKSGVYLIYKKREVIYVGKVVI